MLLDLGYDDVCDKVCGMLLCGNGTLEIGMFGTGGDRRSFNDDEPTQFVEALKTPFTNTGQQSNHHKCMKEASKIRACETPMRK